MVKYSYEFKKKIVLEYLNTPEGYDSILQSGIACQIGL